MDPNEPGALPSAVIDRDGLDALIATLAARGYQVLGPRLEAGAIVQGPVGGIDDLPEGWLDVQDGGSYRLERGAGSALFAHVVGPHSWKRWLYPPKQALWRAERRDGGFTVTAPDEAVPRYAFLGVRACELAAIAIQDRVFGLDAAPPVTDDPPTDGAAAGGTFLDPGYAARRAEVALIAVNCGRAASTCFCVSMDTGPRATGGYDLALTELIGDGRHEFLVEVASELGAELLGTLAHRPAETADIKAAEAATRRATAQNRRAMVPGVAELLEANREHRRWDEVAQRCLACGNCTMVCPTCFCTTVEDTTDLTGRHAERWRVWDSCYSLEFSYIHGGPVRTETSARYRHWITHKLSAWHQQFGSSGCTGCGRCITWCPVGIDITEEARAIRDSQGPAR